MIPRAILTDLRKHGLSSDRTFAIALTLAIGLLGLLGLSRHAMWRDELNAWLVATDSRSWADLLANVKYEGHPLLWYLSLAAVKQIWDDPRAMQLLHLGLALASIWLILRYAPAARWQRALLAFGYLPFYEYLLISRNYAWGLLSLLLFCTLWPTRQRTYLGLAIALVLAANANAYCLLIASALGLTLVLDARWWSGSRAPGWDRVLSASFVLAGLAIACAPLLPPADSQLQGGLESHWMLHFNLRHLLTALTRIWNSYIVVLVPGDSSYFDVALFAGFSLLLLAGAIAYFRRQPAILCFYLSGTLAILGLTYVKFLGSARHYGHLFVVLAIALWLSRQTPVQPPHPQPQTVRRPWHKTGARLLRRGQALGLTAILLGQTAGGLVAFSRDLVVPYSAGRATAAFIQQQGWADEFIVASEDKVMATLAGYLGRELYYPETGELGSFVLFDRDRQAAPMQAIFAQVQRLLRDRNSVLLVLNYPLAATHTELAIAPLAEFTEALIFNEKYFLYRVRSRPEA